MTTSQLREILKSNLLLLSENNADDVNLPEEHLEAGAHILLAPPVVHMDDEEADTIANLLDTVYDRAFVAGQIAAPQGGLTEAGGVNSFEQIYEAVLSRAMWLDNQGVSMIFLTDCRDIATAKCAVSAIREASFDMPICVGVAIDGDVDASLQKMLSMLVALQSLDICAFGCTHTDVDDSLALLTELQAFATVPLFSLATAGRFLTPEIYADYIPSLVQNKCGILGLCDAPPALTAAATKSVWQLAPFRPDFPMLNAVCSTKQIVFIDFKGKIVSNQKQMLEIKAETEEEIKKILPIINREDAAPVCFKIKDLDVLEYAISRYNGRPAVCSDEYGEITAKTLGALIMTDESNSKKGEAK